MKQIIAILLAANLENAEAALAACDDFIRDEAAHAVAKT